MNEIEKLFGQTSSARAFAQRYLEYTSEILRDIDLEAICDCVDALLAAREADRTIFVVGNGGSAATACHFANDLAVGVRSARPFRATSLAANGPALTAIANDFGYEHVFVKQLEGRIGAGDVVVGISASGQSANVIAAIEYANQHGGVTIGFSGFEGGGLARLSSVSVHVPSTKGEYGPVEAVHTVLLHIVSNYLMLRCR